VTKICATIKTKIGNRNFKGIRHKGRRNSWGWTRNKTGQAGYTYKGTITKMTDRESIESWTRNR